MIVCWCRWITGAAGPGGSLVQLAHWYAGADGSLHGAAGPGGSLVQLAHWL